MLRPYCPIGLLRNAPNAHSSINLKGFAINRISSKWCDSQYTNGASSSSIEYHVEDQLGAHA